MNKFTLFLALLVVCSRIAEGHVNNGAAAVSVSPSSTTENKRKLRKLGSIVAKATTPSAPVKLIPTPSKSVSKVQPACAAPSSWRGPVCVLGGALAHLTFGSMYCWGNFLSYSPMNLRFFDGKIHPAGASADSALVIPLTLVAQCITMPFGPLVVKAIGARNTLLLGSWMVAAGVYFASYAKDLTSFLLLYSILFGCGAGLGYTAPMVAGWSWLPDLKGLVSGAVLTGYGAGGFFFNLIGTKLVNPNGVDPVNGVFPAEVYQNFPNMLRRLAMIYFGLATFGALLVSEKPVAATPASAATAAIAAAAASKQATKATDKNAKPAVTAAVAAAASVPGLGVLEALGTSQFYLLWAMIFSSASCGLNIASTYKQFASTAPDLKGDAFQSLVGGVGALFNGGGRLFWGSLSDKIGFKKSFFILTIAQVVNQLLYNYSGGSKAAFLAATCLSFFLLAGNFAMMPPATYKLFGPKNGALIYGIIYTAFASASIAVTYLSKIMLAKLGWAGVFQVLAASSLLATFLTTLLKPVKSLPSSVA